VQIVSLTAYLALTDHMWLVRAFLFYNAPDPAGELITKPNRERPGRWNAV